jgi:thiamine pyrophosphate-dependent acetolactate synthase large subunit-like protein
MDLDRPSFDWPQLSRSLGVRARRIEHAEDLADAVRAAGELTAPLLLEVPVAGFGDEP